MCSQNPFRMVVTAFAIHCLWLSSGVIIIFRRKCISEPCTFYYDAALQYLDGAFASGMLTGSIILMLPLVFFVDGVFELILPRDTWIFFGPPIVSTTFAYGLYFASTARLRAVNLSLAT